MKEDFESYFTLVEPSVEVTKLFIGVSRKTWLPVPASHLLAMVSFKLCTPHSLFHRLCRELSDITCVQLPCKPKSIIASVTNS